MAATGTSGTKRAEMEVCAVCGHPGKEMDHPGKESDHPGKEMDCTEHPGKESDSRETQTTDMGLQQKTCDVNFPQPDNTSTSQDMFGARCQDVHVQRPDTFSRRYQVRLGEETIQAPMGLFYPQLFGLVATSLVHTQLRNQGDPEDIHDEHYLLQTQSTQQQVAKAVAEKKAKASSKQDHGPDGDKTAPDSKPSLEPRHKRAREDAGGSEAKHRRGVFRLPSASRRGSEPAPLKLMGVDQAILHSIECCASDETKKKMFSCILVVGGGMKFPGVQNFLLHRVRSQLPAKYRNIANTMEVITRPKDQDPQMVCWKGAAVLACLDTTQELWVGQREWRKFGIRILRERSPFVW
ncbi:actin-related protein 8-like isoform X2 [Branchiostoma floridae x Branchiostoma japonicum]